MIIPQSPTKRNPKRLLLGTNGAPSTLISTRYYLTADNQVLVLCNGNTAIQSRDEALKDLQGKLSRLQGYVGADECREQMMMAIEATIEAIEEARI